MANRAPVLSSAVVVVPLAMRRGPIAYHCPAAGVLASTEAVLPLLLSLTSATVLLRSVVTERDMVPEPGTVYVRDIQTLSVPEPATPSAGVSTSRVLPSAMLRVRNVLVTATVTLLTM